MAGIAVFSDIWAHDYQRPYFPFFSGRRPFCSYLVQDSGPLLLRDGPSGLAAAFGAEGGAVKRSAELCHAVHSPLPRVVRSFARARSAEFTIAFGVVFIIAAISRLVIP